MNDIRNFFTRHLLLGPLSLGSWLYFIFGMGINIFAATGLIIAMYLGGSFTIKQIQKTSTIKKLGLNRSEYNYIQAQLKAAQIKLKRLNSHYSKVRSVRAFRQLHEINMLARKVLGIVKENPRRFYDVENFFYAHLDSAVELTANYSILANQPLKDKELQIALQNTRETLSDVNKQLEADLRSALATDMNRLRMELDFVKVTIDKKKPVLEMKGETYHERK